MKLCAVDQKSNVFQRFWQGYALHLLAIVCLPPWHWRMDGRDPQQRFLQLRIRLLALVSFTLLILSSTHTLLFYAFFRESRWWCVKLGVVLMWLLLCLAIRFFPRDKTADDIAFLTCLVRWYGHAAVLNFLFRLIAGYWWLGGICNASMIG